MEFREGGLTNGVRASASTSTLLSQALGLKSKVVEILSQASPLLRHRQARRARRTSCRKRDALNDKEWEDVRKHPEIGAGIIGEHKDPLLEQARVMALTHHERWDGTGYPKKLKGNAIPVPGRIMAVADAFEAMTTTQRHRSPISSMDAAKRIQAESGKQFDPSVVAAFMKVVKEFDEVRAQVQGRTRRHPRPELRAGEEEIVSAGARRAPPGPPGSSAASAIAAIVPAPSRTRNAAGCATASQSPAGTSASSANDAVQLLSGSGERLIELRAPAFAKCAPAATAPPRIAAAAVTAPGLSLNAIVTSAAPAGMRMKVCTASQTLSIQGTLSAKNSTASMRPLAPSTSGCDSSARLPGRSIQPIRPASPHRNSTA